MPTWVRLLVVTTLLPAVVAVACPDARAELKVNVGGTLRSDGTIVGGTTRTIDANLDLSDTSGDPFWQQVQDCIDELEGYGKDQQLKELQASTTRCHTILKTSGVSSASYFPSGKLKSDGTANTGSDTFVRWNPTNSALPNGYTDGTPRDPCGAFLHEIIHAHDAHNGVLNTDPMTTSGTDKTDQSEVRACQAQNWLHEEKGLPSRTDYSGNDLPKGVRFDACPDCIRLTFAGGLVVDLTPIVYEVPVTGQGSPNSAVGVDGREYEIRDGTNTLRGKVSFIKEIDGRVRIVLTAEAGETLSLTAMQFKQNGAVAGEVIPFSPALDVGGTGPATATSPPLPVPALAAIRVNKKNDNQTVAPGGRISWKICVKNIGGVDLMNVQLTDAPFNACNQAIGNLAVGEEKEFTCSATAGATEGDFVNTAQVSGQGPAGSGGPATSQDTAPFTVKTP